MTMPAHLNTESNLAAPDDFYELLVSAHRDLEPDQSRLVNAKLVLLFANHIGDMAIIAEAIGAAREGVAPGHIQPDLALTA